MSRGRVAAGRPHAELRAESLEDLGALVVDRGEGFDAQTVAISLRCTPTLVRRARLAAGLEPERGRPLEVNGNGPALGLELVANGYSLRAAALISGTPRSTLHDRARAAE